MKTLEEVYQRLRDIGGEIPIGPKDLKIVNIQPPFLDESVQVSLGQIMFNISFLDGNIKIDQARNPYMKPLEPEIVEKTKVDLLKLLK